MRYGEGRFGQVVWSILPEQNAPAAFLRPRDWGRITDMGWKFAAFVNYLTSSSVSLTMIVSEISIVP